jgi:hypothetical protein
VEALVEVTEVTEAPLDAERLRGFAVDRPSPGTREGSSATHSIELAGWALGRDSRVVAIEVSTRDSTPLIELPLGAERPDVAAAHAGAPGADTSGFHAWVSTLGLPPAFELRLCAVQENGARVELASVRGRRRALEARFEPRIQPLMVTTLARTGSTILVRLLGSHPDLLAYRPFQYEPRVARYWMEVLRTLTEPVSYLRQITHAAKPNDRHWWIGLGAPLPQPLLDPGLEAWMGAEGVESLATLCQNRIDALYERIASEQGRPDARYFVEKNLPNMVPRLLWELYPGAREIILVRDFRDMVSSMLALNEKRGYAKFGRERVGSDREHIEQLGRTGVKRLLASWRERADRAHLLRYEDLILRPREALEALLTYLGLDSSAATIEAIGSGLAETTPDSERHRTSADPRSSIGRWRNDLNDELQRACESALGPALEAFGYEPGRKGSLAEAIG